MEKDCIHFVSGDSLLCEEKTIIWEIKHFPRFLKLDTTEMGEFGLTFEVGHSIGIPATWCFQFYKENSCLMIHLYLKNVTETGAVKADFTITFYDDSKEIWQGKHIDADTGDVQPYMKYNDLTLLQALTKTSVLKVVINVTSFGKSPAQTPNFTPVVHKENSLFSNKLVKDFAKLFTSDIGTDTVMKVPSDDGFYSKRVHKAILVARSPVFAAMFDPESKMLEEEKGVVEILDMSPKSLDILLEYIYTGKVPKNWEDVASEVLNAAEKYDFPELKEFCGRNINGVVKKNIREVLELARVHNLPNAEAQIREILDTIK